MFITLSGTYQNINHHQMQASVITTTRTFTLRFLNGLIGCSLEKFRNNHWRSGNVGFPFLWGFPLFVFFKASRSQGNREDREQSQVQPTPHLTFHWPSPRSLTPSPLTSSHSQSQLSAQKAPQRMQAQACPYDIHSCWEHIAFLLTN